MGHRVPLSWIAFVALFAIAFLLVMNAGAVDLKVIASGLEFPDYITGAHDGSGRLFVIEQRGRIRILLGGNRRRCTRIRRVAADQCARPR